MVGVAAGKGEKGVTGLKNQRLVGGVVVVVVMARVMFHTCLRQEPFLAAEVAAAAVAAAAVVAVAVAGATVEETGSPRRDVEHAGCGGGRPCCCNLQVKQ